MSLTTKIADTIANLLGGVKVSLTETRSTLAELKAQRQVIAAAMVPQAEAEALVDRFVDDVAGAAPFSPSWLTGPGASIVNLRQSLLQPHHQHGLAPMFFLLARDTIRISLKAEITRFYAGKTVGLPAVERAARIEQLDAEIFALEVEEERLISEAEAAGLQVDRRPDADPAAVLGLPRRKAA